MKHFFTIKRVYCSLVVITLLTGIVAFILSNSYLTHSSTSSLLLDDVITDQEENVSLIHEEIISFLKQFEKYLGNPVLGKGTQGEFDYGFLHNPMVWNAGTTYYMLYDGDYGNGLPKGQSEREIGLAKSSDGLNWNKSDANPVLRRGSLGSWDSYKVGIAKTLLPRDDGSSWIYYSGMSGGKWAIGIAVTYDYETYTKHPSNPIMTSSQSWESSTGVKGSCVLYDEGIYKMWYCGSGYVDNVYAYRIGYAESVDGINWAPYDENPIFREYLPQEKYCELLQVFKHDGIYYMLYEAMDATTFRIFLATSTDGIHFKREGLILDIGAVGEWDSYFVLQPWLLFEDTRTLLYYCGMGGDTWDFSNAAIGVAVGPSISANMKHIESVKTSHNA